MIFTGNEDNWFGGFYELALEYRHVSEETLRSALRAIWSTPGVQGCYASNQVEPEAQVPMPAGHFIDGGHIYGVAELPAGHRLPCGLYVVSLDTGETWIDFYLPQGAIDSVGLSHYEPRGSQEWRRPVDEWLCQIGQTAFDAAPFLLGLVGHEICAEVDAEVISRHGVPNEREFVYLTPNEGRLEVHLPTMLQY